MPENPLLATSNPLLIGMVHLLPLPGTPKSKLSVAAIVQQAVDEARVLAKAGFSGVMIENMHDAPYVHGSHGPEITSAMTLACAAVRQALPERVRMGVQVLSGGNKEAIAIAHACGLDFIRCENFVFSHVADEGVLAKAEAGELLRYRRNIGAQRVQIWCDIKKKHASHAITADLSIEDVAQGAEFFGADGLIVTGTATGKPADVDDVEAARASCNLPVLVGSGIDTGNLASFLTAASGLIVGSSIKRSGHWSKPVDAKRCTLIAKAFASARARR